MKTGDSFGISLASRQRVPRFGLLWGTLRSPVEVSFPIEIPELARCAGPVRYLWERNKRAEAIAKLTETLRKTEHDAPLDIPMLFLLAHMQTEEGDALAGKRCLQQALNKLGQRADTYVPCDRDWLVLAIHEFLNGDSESCLRWIYQTDRQPVDSVARLESGSRWRLLGDIQVVLACVAVQTNELEEAEKLLSTAYERHSQAEAFRSVCRDLILTSRLARIQGQSQRAASLLDAAECELMMSLTPAEAQHSPLMQIIHAA